MLQNMLDPGLFSISFKSTCPGLKMYDNLSDTWINVPTDCVVLWCGATAEELSYGTIKSGWHSVDLGSEPRITMWYEVCVSDQIPDDILLNNGLRIREKNVQQDNSGEVKTFNINVKTLTGKTLMLEVNNKMTVENLMYLIQDKEGIPPDKQRLITRRSQVYCLDREELLTNYELGEGQVFHLVLRLKGAPSE